MHRPECDYKFNKASRQFRLLVSGKFMAYYITCVINIVGKKKAIQALAFYTGITYLKNSV